MPRSARRAKKTGFAGGQWKRVFADVAKFCSAEAKRRGERFQDCVRRELQRYR
jgi:hypothetical protein